jgi:hypothetical protein
VARTRPSQTSQETALIPNLSVLRLPLNQTSLDRNISTHRLYRRWRNVSLQPGR